MAKIIAMFNHKGGVSKTTTAYNLGWKLAEKGHRTILVDADPQCNLTGVAMNLDFMPERANSSEESVDQATDRAFEEKNQRIVEFWEETSEDNIYTSLKPAFFSEPRMLEGINCPNVNGNENLFLLPGSLNLGEFETALSVAQSLTDTLTTSRNLPGAIYFMLMETAKRMDAEYLIVDMSPSLSSINQNIVSISDMILIPTSPDYYSLMALQSLSLMIDRWHGWAAEACQKPVLRDASYPFPAPRMKFAGAIIQRYKLYRAASEEYPEGEASSSFKRWIGKVTEFVDDEFTPSLSREILFSDEQYAAAELDQSKIIATIPDFNSLLPKAQEAGVPVFALTEEQFGQSGSVLESSIRQRDLLEIKFDRFANRVLALAESD